MKKHLAKISRYRPSLLQGRMDFSAARAEFSLVSEHPLEQQLSRSLVVALCLVAALYLYFVSASILNIIAQKEASARAARTQGTLASLESQYFALGKDMTQSAASSLGLSPVDDPAYVYVPGNLSVNGAQPSTASGALPGKAI